MQPRMLLLLLVLLLGPSVSSAQSGDRSGVGFPFTIEGVETKGVRQYGIIKMYIHLPEPHFKRENLKKLFETISREKPVGSLALSVFSDKEILAKHREVERLGIVDVTSTSDAVLARHLPPQTGYFRASYFRSSQREYFTYSPSKKEIRLIAVTLKSNRLLVNSDEFLFDSVENGDLNAVAWFLQQEPKRNTSVRNRNGSTPLTLAVWLHHNDIAKALIANGADINFPTSSGSTALFAAIDAENSHGVLLLVSAKANVNVSTREGKTPLMAAALYCNYELAEILIRNGAEVKHVDRNGKTALDYACDRPDLRDLLRHR